MKKVAGEVNKKKNKTEGHKLKQARCSKQHQYAVSLAVITSWISFLALLCFPLRSCYTLSATFDALHKAGEGKKEDLKSASVFRWTNGITEAKMAGGER